MRELRLPGWKGSLLFKAKWKHLANPSFYHSNNVAFVDDHQEPIIVALLP